MLRLHSALTSHPRSLIFKIRKHSRNHIFTFKEHLSGRPGSNRRHSAWKADALPTELLPHFILNSILLRNSKIDISKFSRTILCLSKNLVGRAGFEPAKVKTNRFTVCPRWPLEYLPDLNNYILKKKVQLYFKNLNEQTFFNLDLKFSKFKEPMEGLEPTTC